jgi:hypothetical protein
MPALDAISPSARRTMLDVLACMVGVDGEISDEERGAFRGAAIALGLPDAEIERGSELDIEWLRQLKPRESMLVYCAAQWIALADAVQLRDESRLLTRIRHAMRIDAGTARLLAAHARWVRMVSELSWHREADVLISEAARRIEKLEAHARAA